MKKKIDVVVPFFNPPYIGGTEEVLGRWNEYFINYKKHDVEVRFVLPFSNRKGNLFHNSPQNISAPRLFINSKLIKIFGGFFLFFYLLFTKSDSIVVLSPKYIRFCFNVRRIFKKNYKIISWIHFSLSRMFVGNDDDFKKADYHLAISTGIARQLKGMGIAKEKIYTIYNPIDKHERVISASLKPKFIYIGRIEREGQKNLLELIRGFSKVKRILPNATLDIYGGGRDLEFLKRDVEKRKLEDSVVFNGWNRDPWKSVSSGTALVMTSTFEGLPMTILESLSYGLPVVSSDVETGPSDEISDKSGFLYSLGNIDQLSRKMCDAYYNKDIFEKNEIKKSISRFYTNNYFKKLVEILDQIG